MAYTTLHYPWGTRPPGAAFFFGHSIGVLGITASAPGADDLPLSSNAGTQTHGWFANISRDLLLYNSFYTLSKLIITFNTLIELYTASAPEEWQFSHETRQDIRCPPYYFYMISTMFQWILPISIMFYTVETSTMSLAFL